jgi:acetyltransferase-like isoleucine patch superfamily enzyme
MVAAQHPAKGAGALRGRLLDAVAPLYNRCFGCRLRTKGKGNSVTYLHVRRLRKTSVTIVGDHNSVVFAPDAQMQACEVAIRGDENKVEIGPCVLNGLSAAIAGSNNHVAIAENCILRGLRLVCQDNGNTISIGDATKVHGATELAAIEGTAISVGSDCLFADGIHVRTGDSHTITDLGGLRINPSAGICIGNHVWVGKNVMVLKGVRIADSCVVGACSVLSTAFDTPHCSVAGNPARVVSQGVDWRHER